MSLTNKEGPNPSGLCLCGCGNATPIAPQSNSKNGNVNGKPMRFVKGHKISPNAQTFWDYVQKSDGCWEWKGGKHSFGYGVLSVDGKSYLAHRHCYELHYGEIQDDMEVCHKCDNPSCVRPDHLFVGSHDDNMKDKVNKGRQPRGTNVSTAKLTDEKVREARKLRDDGMTFVAIGSIFGTSRKTVECAVKGITWRHIQ